MGVGRGGQVPLVGGRRVRGGIYEGLRAARAEGTGNPLQ